MGGGGGFFDRGLQQKCNFKEGFQQVAKIWRGIKQNLDISENFINNSNSIKM